MKFLTSLTMATSVFAAKMHASLDLQNTPYDAQVIFDFLDNKNGVTDGKVSLVEFSDFIKKTDYPGKYLSSGFKDAVQRKFDYDYGPEAINGICLDDILDGACAAENIHPKFCESYK